MRRGRRIHPSVTRRHRYDHSANFGFRVNLLSVSESKYEHRAGRPGNPQAGTPALHSGLCPIKELFFLRQQARLGSKFEVGLRLGDIARRLQNQAVVTRI